MTRSGSRPGRLRRTADEMKLRRQLAPAGSGQPVAAT